MFPLIEGLYAYGKASLCTRKAAGADASLMVRGGGYTPFMPPLFVKGEVSQSDGGDKKSRFSIKQIGNRTAPLRPPLAQGAGSGFHLHKGAKWGRMARQSAQGLRRRQERGMLKKGKKENRPFRVGFHIQEIIF